MGEIPIGHRMSYGFPGNWTCECGTHRYSDAGICPKAEAIMKSSLADCGCKLIQGGNHPLFVSCGQHQLFNPIQVSRKKPVKIWRAR